MPVKKKDVKVGGYYACRVSDYVVAVRVTSESPYGGWKALNLTTRKEVRIQTAARLRWPLSESEAKSFGKQLPQIAEIRHRMLNRNLDPDNSMAVAGFQRAILNDSAGEDEDDDY